MRNEFLFHYEHETLPTLGVLMADHFKQPYGFSGHRSKGTIDWLLIYTVSGEGSFRVSDDVRISSRGDVVILAPGVPHHYAANEGGEWELLWVHFLPLPEWNTFLQLPRTEERLITLNLADEALRRRVELAFERLILDTRRGGNADQELALLSLAEILILLHQSSVQQANSAFLDERIEQVVHYLSDHVHERHSLAHLARLTGLSESRFRHLFKEQTGKKVSEWIVTARLQKAAKLLDLTAKPVGEIADYVGFESVYYFTRRFTAEFGVSPTSFRKAAQENRRIE